MRPLGLAFFFEVADEEAEHAARQAHCSDLAPRWVEGKASAGFVGRGECRGARTHRRDPGRYDAAQRHRDSFRPIRALPGFEDLRFNQLVQFRIHGISGDYVEDLADAGFTNLRSQEIIQARIHGVSAEYARRMTDRGWDDLDLRDLVQMRIHNVRPEMVEEMAELGFGNLSRQNLVQARIHGVTPQFIEALG